MKLCSVYVMKPARQTSQCSLALSVVSIEAIRDRISLGRQPLSHNTRLAVHNVHMQDGLPRHASQ